MNMRKQIAAGNWKMNLTFTEAEQLLNTVLNNSSEPAPHQQTIFAVPFPYLIMAREKIKGKKNIHIAAQNCFSKEWGAYTGEVSAAMLQSIEIPYVIIGHSERREYFQESNELLAEKINSCLAHNLIPIFCCGEPLPIREANKQNEWVMQQLQESLFHLSAQEISSIIIAYEPVWAIGTGKTATAAQAQEMHAFIRKQIEIKYNTHTANGISILYGGSVKSSNATELFSLPDVDGGLVGGASLIAEEFVKIIHGLKK